MKGITTVCVTLAMTIMLAPVPGDAQRHTELRTVRGTVVDRSGTPVASAVVYLKNIRTLTVKTYISEHSGQYHFSGLNPNTDYEVHAERGSQTSRTHTISSLDSRKEFVVSLKLDREKKNSAL